MDQTALGLSTSHNQVTDLVFQESDREILCRLAGEVAHLASRPSEIEKNSSGRNTMTLKRYVSLFFATRKTAGMR